MNASLANKVVWITGGGEGIGRGIAILSAQCGARVAITGRDREPLEETVREIEAHGGTAMVAAADVTESAQVQQAVESIVAKWNRLDCVVANAGINGKWAPIDEIQPDEWRKTIDVNLTGTYLTIHHSLKQLVASGRGSILIVSSVNGTRMFSNEGASAYASSKAAQLALGQMLALEFAPRKVRVNVICPGAIESNIHDKTEREDLDRIETPVEFPEGNIPLTGGKMGTAEQVAQLAVFLLSDSASHITGTPVWIDGGQSLLQG